MIPIFTVYEEEGILQASIHWRAITDSAERIILTVNNNVLETIRLGPTTGVMITTMTSSAVGGSADANHGSRSQ